MPGLRRGAGADDGGGQGEGGEGRGDDLGLGHGGLHPVKQGRRVLAAIPMGRGGPEKGSKNFLGAIPAGSHPWKGPANPRRLGKPRPQGWSLRRSNETMPPVIFRGVKMKKIAAIMLAFAAGLTAAQAQKLDKVRFGTNWVAEAEHGGFYQALADGTYKKYGLDVDHRPRRAEREQPHPAAGRQARLLHERQFAADLRRGREQHSHHRGGGELPEGPAGADRASRRDRNSRT